MREKPNPLNIPLAIDNYIKSSILTTPTMEQSEQNKNYLIARDSVDIRLEDKSLDMMIVLKKDLIKAKTFQVLYKLKYENRYPTITKLLYLVDPPIARVTFYHYIDWFVQKGLLLKMKVKGKGIAHELQPTNSPIWEELIPYVNKIMVDYRQGQLQELRRTKESEIVEPIQNEIIVEKPDELQESQIESEPEVQEEVVEQEADKILYQEPIESEEPVLDEPLDDPNEEIEKIEREAKERIEGENND